MLFLQASASQKIYVMSLTDNMKGIWTNLSQVGQVAVRKGPRVDQYVWDLHNFTDNSKPLQNGFVVMDNADPFWQQVWVDKYSDDAGIRFITQLPTYFAVAPFNHKIADKQTYKVDINYSPLISSLDTVVDGIVTSKSETNIGEHILYGSMIYPAYPLLFTTSIPKQNHYGPVFVQQASFSVSGDNTITPVSIRLSAIGGKSFQCPSKPVSNPSLQTITLTDVPVGDEFDPDSPNPNANTSLNSQNNDSSSPQTVQDFKQYRVATLQDCLFDTDVYDDFPTFFNTVLSNNVIEAITPVNRIVAMELHIKQNVIFTATGLDAVGAIRTQEQGPRWVAIKDRTVEGSITYFSHDSDFTLPKSGGITMYFGGCYYFPMPNVDWQKPTMQAEAVQGGYIHVFNFIARACVGAITNGFSTAGLGMPVSEFNVGTQYFDNL